MAGHVPAIRIYSMPIVALVVCVATPLSVTAQVDTDMRRKMEQLYRDLIIAEENLNIAVRDRDVARGKVTNSLLFQLGSNINKQTPTNSCNEALNSLANVAVIALFYIYPPVTGNPFSMTQEDLGVYLHKMPDNVMQSQFAEHSSHFKKKMTDCEREFGLKPTSRSLSEVLDDISRQK
jgi:hypothetical protein